MSNYEQYVLTDDPGAASDPKPESLLIDKARKIIDELKKKAKSATTETEFDSILAEMSKIKEELAIALEKAKEPKAATETKKTETVEPPLEGRDPEKFLNDFFDWNSNSRNGWRYTKLSLSNGKIIIDMRLSGIEAERIPSSFVDKKLDEDLGDYSVLSDDVGIENLLHELKGKKVISAIFSGGWCLEVVEPSVKAPIEFDFIEGGRIFSDGRQEFKGLKVGTLLKPKTGADLREEVLQARKLELVGFQQNDEYIIRLDDGKVVNGSQYNLSGGLTKYEII